MSTDGRMTIMLDGQPYELPRGTPLIDLVASLGLAQAAAATAVNGVFVARGQREARMLQPGDAVLLVHPITGG